MRAALILLPLALTASPVLAQPAPQLPPEMTDPATADRLANMMQVMSKAFLDLPVGAMEAAAQGREPTAREKKMTVRDYGRRKDPNFDRNFEQRIAASKPMIRQSVKAMTQALPQFLATATQLSQTLERAAANLPDPSYPKR